MESATTIMQYLKAGFPAIWIKTDETERIQSELIPMIEASDLSPYVLSWDLTNSPDPMQPIAELHEAHANSIMFAENYHWFIGKPQPIQALKKSLAAFSAEGKTFIVVSPIVALPKELEKDFLLLSLQLPDCEEIGKTLDFITQDLDNVIDNRQKIIDMSKGLTKRELENIYSLSLVKEKKVDPNVISQFKSQTIEKSGFLSVLKPRKSFKDIVGYSVVKDFISRTIDNPKAKGIILVGPPGCGKTSLAEAVVAESGKFGIQVDMGKLFSKFVGDTDKNIDYAINLIKSIGNCLVLIDEMEKSFAGAGSSGDNDSGTTRRALAKWLNFLQDRPQGVYVIATCNSFKGMPPEYLRPGRWDTSPFYIDLPSEEVRNQILSHYAKINGVKLSKKSIALDNFSGAELEALVNISSMLNQSIEKSLDFVIPIAKTMPQEINELRNWAAKSCIPSDKEQSKTLTRRLKID